MYGAVSTNMGCCMSLFKDTFTLSGFRSPNQKGSHLLFQEAMNEKPVWQICSPKIQTKTILSIPQSKILCDVFFYLILICRNMGCDLFQLP